MTPHLDVIIVNHNTRDDVLQCLGSLAATRIFPGRVFVVDNASSDGSVDAIRNAHPSVHVVPLERNAGFGAANNVALRLSEADLVLLLNSDTLVPAGAIDALAGRLLATGAVAVGPRLVDGDGNPEISFGPMLTPAAEAIQAMRVRFARSGAAWARRLTARHLSRDRSVDWVTGACLLVRRPAAIAAGLFDERYFLYEEDVDFCAALRAQGGTILFTSAITITHLRGQTMRRAPSMARTHYDRSHLAFYEKHAPLWAPILRVWLRMRGRSIR